MSSEHLRAESIWAKGEGDKHAVAPQRATHSFPPPSCPCRKSRVSRFRQAMREVEECQHWPVHSKIGVRNRCAQKLLDSSLNV
jgi:hypothetical protein